MKNFRKTVKKPVRGSVGVLIRLRPDELSTLRSAARICGCTPVVYVRALLLYGPTPSVSQITAATRLPGLASSVVAPETRRRVSRSGIAAAAVARKARAKVTRSRQ